MKKGDKRKQELRVCQQCQKEFWFRLCYSKRPWKAGSFCSMACRKAFKFRVPETKKQAQSYISNAVRDRRMPPAKTLVCTDCGGPAHDYDHYLGYGIEHYADVQPVCVSCHKRRGVDRGEIPIEAMWAANPRMQHMVN